uniref:DNA replication/repair protein RecF n=1 Tax=Roseivirga sp. TaxID=1964215 RepID=UPI004047A31F
MHLESIGLHNFKNYESLNVAFSPEINCFVGKNGSGKTNLLDAIYYLCITRSAFNPQDNQCTLHGEDFFSLKGKMNLGERTSTIVCGMQLGKKKLIKLDDKPYKKASEHLGRFPVVLIAPNDTDIIRNGSEDRRKFFDAIIAQTSQVYLNQLIDYNHILKQRNGLLKQFADRDYFDAALLQQYTDQLIDLGGKIYAQRKSFINAFKPLVEHHYAQLSEESEPIDLLYESDFDQDIAALFKQNIKKDIILKRTNVGIHKDDYPFIMEGELIKKFGSQGQQKSYLIALKLANFDYINTETGSKPLLLLDDIFDKLDDFRITKLMEMVASDAFGQIFVTDARPERSHKIFDTIGHEVKFFEVEGGRIEATNP